MAKPIDPDLRIDYTVPLEYRMVYSPQDVANLLGISRVKVYGILDEGEIRSVRIGTHRRIRREDLIAYLDRLEHNQNR